MNDKLDVFEILGADHKTSYNEGQGQGFVPDPDFNEAIKQLGNRYPEQKPPQKSKVAKVIDKVEIKKPEVPRGVKSKRTEKSVKLWQKPILQWLVSIAVILLFFTFVINVPKVVGSSRAPCLENGDRIVINLLARNFEAGDIVVFKTADGDKLVKRIVAVDGDVINITPEKEFYINGALADEDYIYTETAVTDIMVAYPVIVSEDTYFVMGDNRTNSKDSRNSDIGLVKKEDIVGKVIFCMRKI